MKILVLNCGSSSLKYQLIDMENEGVLAKGNFEKIGLADSFLTHKVSGQKYVINEKVDNHEEAIKIVLEQFTNSKYGVIKDLNEISAIGHRIVQGGEYFDKSEIVTNEVVEKIEKCIELAPLHNGAAIKGIEACKKAMPGKLMVVTFDTAFHQTISKEKYLYPIPYEFYDKYKIRKYGAHGTSYRYVANRAKELMNREKNDLKLIVCHLGQGASLCAIENGKSVDTSMGLTPMGGIMMCQRVGDLDPSVLTFLMKKENLNSDETEDLLNKKSGLLGVTDVSSDFREVEKAASEGNEKAKMAMDMYVYKVAQFVAKYIVTLQGVDAIAFSGGIGENQVGIREKICDWLKVFGVEIDKDANNCKGEEVEISKQDSKIKVFVIPTNEELVIARDTMKLYNEIKERKDKIWD